MATPVYQTVILGGGFAGLFTALHLSHHHYPRSVILIDQRDRFCFKPLLYEYFSGEMDANQVVPRYEELLNRSGVIFVQDAVQEIDLHQRQVSLTGGDRYTYSNLVLALGSITGYFGVEGAEQHALPFRTQEDAIAIDRHIRDCLQQAVQLQDIEQRRQLLTTAVIGAGPSGVEMAGTLADLLPQWYEALGGNPQEVRVALVNHGPEILEGDINSQLRDIAQNALHHRATEVDLLMGAKVTAIRPNRIEYSRNDQPQSLSAGTIIWTTGTNTHPLIKSLPIPDENRDKHGRIKVTPTLQLPDFPEVFAGGDCAVGLQTTSPNVRGYEAQEHQSDQRTSVEEQEPQLKPLPPTAQVAYQQGYAIAYNLRAMALGYDLKPARVNLRGTLLKLGLDESVANLFNKVEITGELGHFIRQGTYLELLPTPIHDFKATAEWLKDEIFERQDGSGHSQAAKVAGVVGGAIASALIAKKLLNALSNES
ncbi:MAG TPA: NAD(P)/FAD-dependent oxidoreductase [Crinalium sp.]|jgi:NADH dehydrogenase